MGITDFIGIISGLLVLSSAAFALFSRARTQWSFSTNEVIRAGEQTKAQSADETITPWAIARSRVITRLQEARSERLSQLSIRKWSSVSSHFLTISQYVIGGALASSFVQETLSPKWVGGLGVLVLVASLFKQQFHPEINSERAGSKSYRLKSLITTSEDLLSILDAKNALGQDHSDAMVALMTSLTQNLNEIEKPDQIDTQKFKAPVK
jgi:hypothetical protein